ncbi:Tyrocidine synthase 3 [Symbiodinium microadriaticum]|uniref:Tyrocidine synthase 3 n=1 Tax=Symbiodinium microadriaticum TaxID=2951 RepID=A0A1Q9CW66_SYMMI|nr:Tyrocidine synthase 3 [Symbiodinium microadriaticum]
MPRGFLAALLGPEDAPNWEAPVPPRHRPLQGVKDTPLDASVAVCPFPTSRRWAHLSSFLAGEVHFHAPIDNAAANSTYTTSSREDDDTSPFSAKQALAPGTGYWCSTGKHEPKDLVIWTGIMHKRRKVRALKVSWAYAPGWVRVRSTPDGKHWDTTWGSGFPTDRPKSGTAPMAQCSRPPIPLPQPQSVPEAYEHQAIETPRAAAICVPGQFELSYEVVVERSRLLACRLSERFAAAQTEQQGSVGILVDRTHPDFLPLLLACARCLRPFILLSTDLPDAARQDSRNRFLVETLQPCLLVSDTSDRIAAIPLTEGEDWISLEDPLFNVEQQRSLGQSALDRVQKPQQGASDRVLSLMCTGGSQRLKIAKVTHCMMLHEFRYYADICGLEGAPPRVLQNLRSFWPAAVVGQLSLTLALAGCAVVSTTAEPLELLSLVQAEQIDVVGLVPDQLRLLAEDPKKQLPNVRLVIAWAERLPPALADRWRGHPAKFIELLIATEYWLSFYGHPLQTKGEDRTGTLLQPVGSTVKFAVLDESLTPVAAGQVGELYLHGPMLCAGYVDAADTDGQFLMLRGRRYFKTRDLVRLMPGGGFVYHSRADRHAKLRGQFVDLAALEQNLQDTEGVQEAFVLEDESGDLFAFLSLNDSCRRASGLTTASRAVSRAKELLPWRAALRLRSALPRSATGKLDGQALQQVVVAEKLAQEAKATAPHLRRRLKDTCRKHMACALALLLTACAGDALVESLLRLASRNRLYGSTPSPPSAFGLLSAAYSWLAMAQLEHWGLKPQAYVDSLPISRMGSLFLLHLAPARRMRGLLTVLGAIVAAGRRRLFAWPLVFWLGCGAQLDFEAERSLRHGCVAACTRLASGLMDSLDEAVKQLCWRMWSALFPKGFRVRRRFWPRVARETRDTGSQWEQYPQEEQQILEYDLWVVSQLSAVEDPGKQDRSTWPPEKQAWDSASTRGVDVVFSKSACDWALETFGTGSEASAAATEPELPPFDRRVVDLVRQVMPSAGDLESPLKGLDSLRAGWLAGSLQSLGRAVSSEAVRRATNLKSLVRIVKAAPAAPKVAPAGAAEYAIWFTPGQFQPMSPWLTRAESPADVPAMRLAVEALLERHPSLRAVNIDSMALRGFVLSCASLFAAILGPKTPASLRSAIGALLLRCWPRVAVDVPHVESSKDTAVPFAVLEFTGQSELERHLQSRGWHLTKPPFEVTLLQLKIALEGVWDCQGGHISIVRVDGGDLVYVDSQRWQAAVLRAPEDPRSPAPPVMSRPLLAGRLGSAGVWLRVVAPGEMQVWWQSAPGVEPFTFSASRIPQQYDRLDTISFVMMQCYHAFGDGYCYSPIASDLFDAYEACRAPEPRELPPARDEALGILQRRLKEQPFAANLANRFLGKNLL